MANGVDVWLDEWEINPGDNPVRKIFDEGLAQCQVVVLVLSAASVQKPWVREELDAAFVKKVEGKARLIPLRLDHCEIPECLKTTRWESIDNVNDFETALKRVIDGIYGHYPKPPLGSPPPYAEAPFLRIANLNRIDSIVFERACRIAICEGQTLVNEEPLLKSLGGLDLTEAQIADSQEILEEYGFIERIRTLGPHRIYSFSITLFGFHEFAKTAIPDFNNLVSEIAAILVQSEHMTGNSIAAAIHQPIRLVEHILEVLENNNLIQISRQHGGDYMTVWQVSAKLRRSVDEN